MEKKKNKTHLPGFFGFTFCIWSEKPKMIQSFMWKKTVSSDVLQHRRAVIQW